MDMDLTSDRAFQVVHNLDPNVYYTSNVKLVFDSYVFSYITKFCDT